MTEAQVRALERTWDADVTDPEVTPFLTTAALLVSEELAGASVTAARLDEITKWLAAHLFAMRDATGRRVEHRTGDARERYGGQLGLGLDHTRYGQTVKILDPTGKLAALGRRAAEFRAVATDPH